MEELSPAAILAISILVGIAAWYAWPHVCGGRERYADTVPRYPTGMPPAQPRGAPIPVQPSASTGRPGWMGWGSGAGAKKSTVEPFCGAAHASCGF